MARRRRRKQGALPDAVVGTLLMVLGVVLIGALGGGAWWIAQRPKPDPVTNCAPSGPQAINLVIFDQTDPVTPQQAQRIRLAMEQMKMAADVGDRFDIYSFEGDARSVLEPRLQMCRPPDKANEWIENVEKARLRYVDFETKLDTIVDELLKASTRPKSPIIESLRAAAVTSFGLVPAGKGVRLRVILFSDMIQHSDLYSQFTREADFTQLAKSPQWPQLRPDLRGADTEIFYLLRPEARRANGGAIQKLGHQVFWEQLVTAAGGHLKKIEAY